MRAEHDRPPHRTWRPEPQELSTHPAPALPLHIVSLKLYEYIRDGTYTTRLANQSVPCRDCGGALLCG